MTTPDAQPLRDVEPAAPPTASPTASDTGPADAVLETALAKLEAKRREYDALHDKYLRLGAEFENHKRLAAREREQQALFANEELLKEWLPVVDNIERALHHATTHTAPAAVVEGWALILKQCREVLDRAGVTVIESLGRPFNPEWHQAIARRESGDAESNTILEEAQRGYLMNGRLLRPALVVVAARPAEAGHSKQRHADKSRMKEEDHHG
jgi:molecular chaperone GrpE